MIAAAIVSNLVYAINGISAYAATSEYLHMPPHAHLHMNFTSRSAIGPTTFHRAASYATKIGLGPIVGTPVILQPSTVVHVSSRTDAPSPAPGKLSLLAPVANA